MKKMMTILGFLIFSSSVFAAENPWLEYGSCKGAINYLAVMQGSKVSLQSLLSSGDLNDSAKDAIRKMQLEDSSDTKDLIEGVNSICAKNPNS